MAHDGDTQIKTILDPRPAMEAALVEPTGGTAWELGFLVGD